jgi:hypothetical protein
MTEKQATGNMHGSEASPNFDAASRRPGRNRQGGNEARLRSFGFPKLLARSTAQLLLFLPAPGTTDPFKRM